MAAQKYDVLIIGAGHNALVAATYLAKAGKRVKILEANNEIGGATTSVKVFPDFDARLSRYAYLVSLLPEKIVTDLGLNFTTLSRKVSSYTPFIDGDKSQGLYIAREWDSKTSQSFNELRLGSLDAITWQNFYGEIATFARKIAPSVLKPLPTRSELKREIGMPDVWKYMIEKPIGETIIDRFQNDVVRGIVATDALIGTFVSAFSLQANKCFLYHLMGNGEAISMAPCSSAWVLAK